MRELGTPLILMLTLCSKCWAMSRNEIEDFSNFLRKTSVLDQSLKDGFGSDHESDEVEEAASDDAWEQSGKFEGDLILNDRQRRLIVEDVAEGLSRNGLKDSTKRWPDNEVIYYIQKEHFSGDQVRAIEDGIDDLARASCVKFRPYQKGDRDAVVIQGSRRGCFSQVGYQGGYQVLNLSGRHPVGRGCFRHGTVVHELLHTLGFFHMQSSPDRDDYIDVVWENIVQPARHNFKKYNTFSVSDFGVGYDYESVLHYGRRAFSNNGKDTLVPKMDGAEIGQRIGLSDKDTQKLNKMYCDSDSNNSDEEEVPQKHHPKKKPSNQPFQGHGIGYHQGKALVIKLPAAKTFSLTDKSIHKQIFDDFSKSPKALLPKAVQGFRAGKKVDEYPVKSQFEDSSDLIKELNKKHDYDFSEYTKDHYQPQDFNTASHKPENEHTPKDSTSKMMKSSGNQKDYSHLESEKFDLDEHLKDLDKIVKAKVYPSQKDSNFLFFKKDYDGFKQPKDFKTTYEKSKNYDKGTKCETENTSTHEKTGNEFGSKQFDEQFYFSPNYKNKYKPKQLKNIKTTHDKSNEDYEFSNSKSGESSLENENADMLDKKKLSLRGHFADIDKVIVEKGPSPKNTVNFLNYRNDYKRLNNLRKESYFPSSVNDNNSNDKTNEDYIFDFSNVKKDDDAERGKKYKYQSHEDFDPNNSSDDYYENINNYDDNNKNSKEENNSKNQPPHDVGNGDSLNKSTDKSISDVNDKDDSESDLPKYNEAFKEIDHRPLNPAIKEVFENIEDLREGNTDRPYLSIKGKIDQDSDDEDDFIHNNNNSSKPADGNMSSKSNRIGDKEHARKEINPHYNPKSEVLILKQHKSLEEFEMSHEPMSLKVNTAKTVRHANINTLTYSSAEKIQNDSPYSTVQPVRYEIINYLPYTHEAYSPDTYAFDTYDVNSQYLSYPNRIPNDYHPYSYDSHFDPDFSKHSGSIRTHEFH